MIEKLAFIGPRGMVSGLCGKDLQALEEFKKEHEIN